VSEYKPTTGELRAAMHPWGWVESDGSITFTTSPTPPSIDVEQSLAISGSDFDRLCDAIDSIHAQLEREYDELRIKYVNANRHALHMERENESLKAELDRVLGEQEGHQHSISEVTVTVTPRLDWSAVVADLRGLTALCERTKEDA